MGKKMASTFPRFVKLYIYIYTFSLSTKEIDSKPTFQKPHLTRTY